MSGEGYACMIIKCRGSTHKYVERKVGWSTNKWIFYQLCPSTYPISLAMMLLISHNFAVAHTSLWLKPLGGRIVGVHLRSLVLLATPPCRSPLLRKEFSFSIDWHTTQRTTQTLPTPTWSSLVSSYLICKIKPHCQQKLDGFLLLYLPCNRHLGSLPLLPLAFAINIRAPSRIGEGRWSSPALFLLLLWTYVGDPSTRVEKNTNRMHSLMRFLNCSQKPSLVSINFIAIHLSESKALQKSKIMQAFGAKFLLPKLIVNSLVRHMFSSFILPFKNALWFFEINFGSTTLSLSTMILEIVLYATQYKRWVDSH